jgi:beta-alanine--pyruvate transaminase
MALAYHRMRGDVLRTKLIGRERGYHGVGFGGIAVGGIAGNRKHFGPSLSSVDHLRHPLDISRNAFSRGLPLHGAELADEFEQRLLALHDPATVAALIVEPVQGSTGVIIPPKGYLEKLRTICDKYGILLIFDEVITGFGRLGSAFAADYFGVIPDLICCAKGLTNAAVPMGAVIAKQSIHDVFMQSAPENSIEFYHGYTYSGHPLACAAAIATMQVYNDEKLFDRAASMSAEFEQAAHSLKGLPHVKDIRNLGLVCGIELESLPSKPTARAYEVFERCFWEKNLLIRTTGDIIALSPPLIINHEQIDTLFSTLAEVIQSIKYFFDSNDSIKKRLQALFIFSRYYAASREAFLRSCSFKKRLRKRMLLGVISTSSSSSINSTAYSNDSSIGGTKRTASSVPEARTLVSCFPLIGFTTKSLSRE